MQNNFNQLIDSFIEDKIGITENFLSGTLSNHLKTNLHRLYAENLLNSAGTGNNKGVTQDKSFRSDKIYWLDRTHNDPHENSFFDLMDSFVSFLNSSCYTGITGYEFHYTLYEQGTFYKRHLDQFRNDDSRQYSMIVYLNDDWQTVDGGELCVYHNHKEQKIEPTGGKMVFFRSSDLEHEVLVTHKPRLSITGWLKRDTL